MINQRREYFSNPRYSFEIWQNLLLWFFE